MAEPEGPRVLISYAHEFQISGHVERAYDLSQSLRRLGVDASIDRYVEHDPPYWPRWMQAQIAEARFVLCLASPLYRERCEARGDETIGRGARWEGLIVTEELYASQSTAHRKFIPVLLDGCEVTDIPDVLRPLGTTHYRWPADHEILYRRLTNQPQFVPEPIGEVMKLPVFRPGQDMTGTDEILEHLGKAVGSTYKRRDQVQSDEPNDCRLPPGQPGSADAEQERD